MEVHWARSGGSVSHMIWVLALRWEGVWMASGGFPFPRLIASRRFHVLYIKHKITLCVNRQMGKWCKSCVKGTKCDVKHFNILSLFRGSIQWYFLRWSFLRFPTFKCAEISVIQPEVISGSNQRTSTGRKGAIVPTCLRAFSLSLSLRWVSMMKAYQPPPFTLTPPRARWRFIAPPFSALAFLHRSYRHIDLRL